MVNVIVQTNLKPTKRSCRDMCISYNISENEFLRLSINVDLRVRMNGVTVILIKKLAITLIHEYLKIKYLNTSTRPWTKISSNLTDNCSNYVIGSL